MQRAKFKDTTQNSKSILKKRAYYFAIKIIRLLDKLPKDYITITIGKQLIRSATSIGANIIDTTLVLGLMVIFGRKMKVGGKKLFSITYLPLALLVFGYDGVISRLEGAFLIIFFAVYLFIIIMKETGKSRTELI